MSDPNLTPYPGSDGVFYSLIEHVPAGWEWRMKITERWHVERSNPDLTGVVVMCRQRPKRWSTSLGASLARDDDDGNTWTVYDGDQPVLTVLLDNGEGIARRLIAFLNHEDEYSQLVMSLARATRDVKTNLTPYVQEAVRLTAQLEGRTGSAIG